MCACAFQIRCCGNETSVYERDNSFYRCSRCDACVVVVNVDKDVFVVAHHKFFHISELPDSVPCFDTFYHCPSVVRAKGIDEINACLVGGEYIGLCYDPDVWCDNGLRCAAFAVA